MGRRGGENGFSTAKIAGFLPFVFPLFSVLPLVLAGCSGPSDRAGDDSEDPIYGGSVDADGANGAVVALRVGEGTKAELCSATAIAPNVLLTARHCVSKSITKTIICDSRGESENGPHFGDDQPVEDIRVFTGAKPDFGGAVSAEVRHILHPDGSVVCNRDIALLVLDRPLDDIKPLAFRATRRVGVTEQIRSVGYGKSDTGASGTRLRKTGVAVRAVGPGLSSSDTALGENEFEVGLSICHGDSGGPAISQTTGAIIGVVSRGGECTEDFGHVYTETAGFTDLIEDAIKLAGAAPPELEPDGPSSAPPIATAPHSNSNGGCSVARPQANGEAFGALALALAAFAARRRRR
jgi:hypothetical protein